MEGSDYSIRTPVNHYIGSVSNHIIWIRVSRFNCNQPGTLSNSLWSTYLLRSANEVIMRVWHIKFGYKPPGTCRHYYQTKASKKSPVTINLFQEPIKLLDEHHHGQMEEQTYKVRMHTHTHTHIPWQVIHTVAAFIGNNSPQMGSIPTTAHCTGHFHG